MPKTAQRGIGSEARARRAGSSQRRLLWLLLAILIFVGGIHYYLVGPEVSGIGRVDSSFSGTPEVRYQALSGLELRRLKAQRKIVRELARRHVGRPTTGASLEDLRVIQAILERAGLERDQTFELQALGVALGDVMAAQLGLEWIALQDDFGRSRALRFGETDVVIFPVTMISKRIEAGLPVSVEELWEKTRKTIADSKPRA